MSAPALIKPCNRSPNRAFIDPDKAPVQSVRAALRLCELCPTRVECAKQALTAGSSLDGSTRLPAADVIQAGVLCRGDEATAVALAEIAGVSPPTVRGKKPRRFPASQCRECSRPMRPWTRGEVEPGFVMHHARGWCVDCRGHYAEHMREERDSRPVQVSRKPVDRRRHHQETAVARLRTRARREGWSEKKVAVEVARLESKIAEEKKRDCHLAA